MFKPAFAFAFALAVIITAAAASLSEATGSIQLLTCSSNNCSRNSCRVGFTVADSMCLESSPTTSQRLKCVSNGHHMCFEQNYWIDVVADAGRDAVPQEHSRNHCPPQQTPQLWQRRMNSCFQDRYGNYAIMRGVNKFLLNLSYECDSQCSKCKLHTPVLVGSCTAYKGLHLRVTRVYRCPVLVEVMNYADSACERPARKHAEQYQIPSTDAVTNCYKDSSERSVMYRCVNH